MIYIPNYISVPDFYFEYTETINIQFFEQLLFAISLGLISMEGFEKKFTFTELRVVFASFNLLLYLSFLFTTFAKNC